MSGNVIFKNTITETDGSTSKETTTVLTINTDTMTEIERTNVLTALYNNVNNIKVNELKTTSVINTDTTIPKVDGTVSTTTNTTENSNTDNSNTSTNTDVPSQPTQTDTTTAPITFKKIENFLDEKYSNLGASRYNFSTNGFVGPINFYVDNVLIFTMKDGVLPNTLTDDITIFVSSLGDTYFINNSKKDHLITIETQGTASSLMNNGYDYIFKDDNIIKFWMSSNVNDELEKGFSENTNRPRANCMIAHPDLDTPVTLTIKVNDEVIGVIENYTSATQINRFFDKEVNNIQFYDSSANQTAVFNRYFREQTIKFQTKERYVNLIEYWVRENEGIFAELPDQNTIAFKLADQLA